MIDGPRKYLPVTEFPARCIYGDELTKSSLEPTT